MSQSEFLYFVFIVISFIQVILQIKFTLFEIYNWTLPESTSFAVTTMTSEPTVESSAMLLLYMVWSNIGLLSFMSITLIVTKALSVN